VDGLKYNPNKGQVWALQNQDANSTLTIINPATQTTSTFAYGPLYNSMSGSRGIDDVVFGGSQILHERNQSREWNRSSCHSTHESSVTSIAECCFLPRGPRDSHPARPSTLMFRTLSASPIRPPAWSRRSSRGPVLTESTLLRLQNLALWELCFIGLLFCVAVSRRVIAKR
jgi:hypothetical protein